MAVSPVERAQVLLLGTIHLSNPGRDLIDLEVDDVLQPHRQQELEALSTRIARFQPTKVCVEHPPSAQSALDAAYAGFLAKTHEPGADEVHQIGFRVARMAGVPTIHGIDDVTTPMRWDRLEAFLDTHPIERRRFDERIAIEQADARERSAELARSPIAEWLAEMNEERSLMEDLSWYVDVLGMADDDEGAAAVMTASWYERNIKIFSNLSRITEPGDRLFVLFGAGHIPILRHLLMHSSKHALVDVQRFLL